jgi:hypothetical protein
VRGRNLDGALVEIERNGSRADTDCLRLAMPRLVDTAAPWSTTAFGKSTEIRK